MTLATAAPAVTFPAARMEFRLLGPLEAVSAGRTLQLGGARLPALLATLLLNANQAVSGENLARALWTQPPRAAESNIRTYVARLRGQFGAPGEGESRLISGPGGYRLRVRSDELDLTRFTELVAEGRQAVDRADRAVALDRLRRALDLWRGDPLAGVHGGPQLGVEGARLEERRLDVVEQWAEVALAAGRAEEVATELARIVPQHPLREQLWVLLMLAYYRSGRQAAALAAYRDVYRLLDQELGIRPGRPLQRLQQRILAADRALDLPQRPAPAVAGAAPRPRQLPADLATFAGRGEQVATLDALTGDPAADRPATVTVALITGTAGVGKTALAMHWAHRVVHRFPDGQLYANLRGFDPTEPPVDPAETLRGFLDALGVPPERIPVGLDARAALYRSLVAGRRMLIVLDNARDAGQVRPLLPGSPGCLAVATGRGWLSGLIATAGAYPMELDLLPVGEARDLLVGRLGARRVAGEPAAVDEIISRCARLPLALALVAARAATRPDRPLGAVAAELRRGDGGLEAFRDGDPVLDVRTVLSWSYRALDPAARGLFRLLGTHPDPEISVADAVGLAGAPTPVVRRWLADLAEARLVTECRPERYAMHALLRAYALDR
ncbi:BTAD domain-containing putative transcriptional regulator [Micromonospora sp. NPDC023966]|uniref:AfsR/SARP family transcriptional regulator n=1 Tax=Micromonospora sp. NPDC023966 TaxID=3154699 RepID=UPI0033FBEA28